jgi:H+/Cl- antiporter ClcA
MTTPAEDVGATLRSKRFVVLLILAAVVGVVVSLASWCFLELVHQIQVGVFTDLPDDLGYHHGAPLWWYFPVLGVAGVLVAFSIVRLPGRGGHIPAHGLQAGGTPQPIELAGVLLAALGTLGLGVVLGPEAPLIALGGGLGVLATKLARKDVPPQVVTVLAASGSFAALSFIFDSPLIAAVILIEATGLGGQKLPLVLLPGLLAAGIGSLVSIGMGSWTGLSTSDYALGVLSVPDYPRPELSDFAWTVPLAVAAAVFTFVVLRFAGAALRAVVWRPFLVIPTIGIAVAGLAVAFAETTDKGAQEVLFSGQEALPSLVSGASTWSLSALALLLAFKGLAWSVSLAGFRGGPTFPALFLGAAGGILASHLPGFALTPAVAVGMAAAAVSMLRLPLSAVVLAIVLTSTGGLGASPLIIVAVVVAYLTTLALSPPRKPGASEATPKPERAAVPA